MEKDSSATQVRSHPQVAFSFYINPGYLHSSKNISRIILQPKLISQ
jgi:hypothetical protein